MKELEINNTVYQVKFDYNFYNRLIEDSNKPRNKKQQGADATQTDGFDQLIMSLVDQDPDAIITAYRAGIVGKKRPTRADVAEALAEAGVWDSKDPYGDLYKELQTVGFLRLKVQHLLTLLKEQITTAEMASDAMQEAYGHSKKDEDKDQIEQTKNDIILARKSYELAKKFLDRLAK